MEAKSKVLSIQRTVHALDESHNMFQNWKDYIHSELLIELGPEKMLVFEAENIFYKPVSFRPTTQQERVANDRKIYLLMFVAAIVLAVFVSTSK